VYQDGTPVYDGDIVPDRLGTPTRYDDWSRGTVEEKMDVRNNRVYQRRVHVETPDGERLIIDIDFTNHGRSDHAPEHFHIYRWKGGSWSKKGNGIPSSGQPGMPDIQDGVYNGPEFWNNP
jgi:hypothetical protein